MNVLVWCNADLLSWSLGEDSGVLCKGRSYSRALATSHCWLLVLYIENPSVLLSLWSTGSPVKRKRGRPKGSKKKSKTDSTDSLVDNSHGQEEENKKQGETRSSLIEGMKLYLTNLIWILTMWMHLLSYSIMKTQNNMRRLYEIRNKPLWILLLKNDSYNKYFPLL